MFCSRFHSHWEQTPAQLAGLQEPQSRADLSSPIPAAAPSRINPAGGICPLDFTGCFWHVFITIPPLNWFVGSRILPHAGWKAQVASALGKAQREGRGECRWECLGAFWECRGTVPRAAQLQRYRERFASLRIKLFITKSNFIVNWFKVILQLCACISYFGKNWYFP